MATNKETLFDNVSGAKWNTGVVFERTNPAPIEKYSVFQNYQDAKTYASTNPVAYPGQIITIVEGTETYSDWTFSDSKTHTMVYSGGKWVMDGVDTASKNTYDLTATATIESVSVTATRTITNPYTITPYKIIDTSGTLEKVSEDIAHATSADYGTVKIGKNIKVNDGVISVAIATKDEVGLVKIGTGLDITSDGTISAQKLSVDQDFSDPTSTNPISTKAVYNKLTSELEGVSSYVNTTFETKSDAETKLTTAKSYTDTSVTSARTDLSTYARETSAYAYSQATAYTDAEITDLSTELKGDISTEAQRAKDAEDAINTRVTNLCGEFQTVSADHETRIKANENAIGLLSSAMHFRGVTTSLCAELVGLSAIPKGNDYYGDPANPTNTPIAGDLVLNPTTSQEFVWAGDPWKSTGTTGKWYLIGDEGTYATKAALEAEVTRATGAESEINTRLNTVSGDLDTLETNFNTLTATTLPLSVGNLATAITNEETARKNADSAISGVVDALSTKVDNISAVANAEIATEVAARSAADAVLSGRINTISTDLDNLEKDAILSVKLNGMWFTVDKNVAEINISSIDCGGAV